MLRSHRLAFGSAVALAVLGSATVAQTTGTASRNAFASALPADTLMYASFPDIGASLADMQSMPLAKMWHEEEVQDFFKRALAMASQQWEQGMAQAREAHEAGMLPFSPDDLVKLRVNSLSIAVTSLDITFVEELGQPLPKIGILAHADFGDSAPIWRNVMQTAMGMVQMQAGDKLQRRDSQVGDIGITTMTPQAPGADALGLSLNIAFVGNGVVFGTTTSEVEGLIGRLTGGGDGLTATDAFRSIAQQVTFAGAEAEMFVRPGSFLDFGMRAMQQAAQAQPEVFANVDLAGIERALTALGLRSIDRVAAASRYVDGRAVTEGFAAAPEDGRRGLMNISSGQLDMGFLRWIPKDAVSFSAMKLAPKEVWNALTAALNAYDPQIGEQMLGALAGMEQELNMSIENDLFGAFGDDIVTWSMPVAAMASPPEMAIILEVPEPERLLRTFEAISQISEGRFSVKKTRRGPYRVALEIDMGGMDTSAFGGMNPMDMLTPTFDFKDGYMVVGFNSGDVLRAFKRLERTDDPSDDIRGNPEFSPYLAKLPKSGIDSLSFTDWKASFESTYQILASLTMVLPINEDIPFEPELLPESRTLTQHLFGSVSWSHTSPEGFRTTSISPFGPETIALLAGGVVAGAAVFATTMGGMDPAIRIR